MTHGPYLPSHEPCWHREHDTAGDCDVCCHCGTRRYLWTVQPTYPGWQWPQPWTSPYIDWGNGNGNLPGTSGHYLFCTPLPEGSATVVDPSWKLLG